MCLILGPNKVSIDSLSHGSTNFLYFFNIAETEPLYLIYGQNEYVKLKYLLKLPFVL